MSTRLSAQVLLVQPPVYDFSLYDLYLKPYGLYRIADWFAASGYTVSLLDCLDWEEPVTQSRLGPVKRKAAGTGYIHQQKVEHPYRDQIGLQRPYYRYGILKEVVRQRISNSRPDIICITTGMTYWYQGVWEVMEVIREMHPEVPVVIGGIYATLLPDHLRSRFPEAVISRGSGLHAIRKVLEDCGLPVGDASLKNHPDIIPGRWKASAVVRMHEGCPCSCDYCASQLLAKEFISGDPIEMLRWVERLKSTTGITNIAWYDDALLVHKQRGIIPFLEELLRRKLMLRFYTPNGLHIDHIDSYTASLMNRSGFQEIRLGFESASDAFHQSHDQKTSLEQLKQALEHLRSGGFSPQQIRVYLLAGLPGQHWEEVCETLNQVCALGIRVSIAEYSPVPETALWLESCRISPYPLCDEPLFHNNSIQPVSWQHFTREDMNRLKDSSRRYSGSL